MKVGNSGGSRRLRLAILWFVIMKRETITIADIYVPTKRRSTLEQKRVDEIAASILDRGLQAPILVRADGERFVLSATRQRVRQQSMAVANPKSLNAIGWHFFQLVA